jgi:hypothetical protein
MRLPPQSSGCDPSPPASCPGVREADMAARLQLLGVDRLRERSCRLRRGLCPLRTGLSGVQGVLPGGRRLPEVSVAANLTWPGALLW